VAGAFHPCTQHNVDAIPTLLGGSPLHRGAAPLIPQRPFGFRSTRLRVKFSLAPDSGYHPAMARLSYLSMGEIAEHLPMLTVQCDRCGRRGRYNTAQLVQRYGAAATGEERRRLRLRPSDPKRPTDRDPRCGSRGGLCSVPKGRRRSGLSRRAKHSADY
jgi:hypothetical protein